MLYEHIIDENGILKDMKDPEIWNKDNVVHIFNNGRKHFEAIIPKRTRNVLLKRPILEKDNQTKNIPSNYQQSMPEMKPIPKILPFEQQQTSKTENNLHVIKLVNRAQTCFMNALFQMLRSSSLFTNKIKQHVESNVDLNARKLQIKNDFEEKYKKNITNAIRDIEFNARKDENNDLSEQELAEDIENKKEIKRNQLSTILKENLSKVSPQVEEGRIARNILKDLLNASGRYDLSPLFRDLRSLYHAENLAYGEQQDPMHFFDSMTDHVFMDDWKKLFEYKINKVRTCDACKQVIY